MNTIFNLLVIILLFLGITYIVQERVQYKLDIQAYEKMATKYNCQFLTPSASRSDVGMFQCDGKIVFKRIEE